MIDKIIGIDIDGVITDESHPNKDIWHNAICEYFGKDIKRVKDSYYFNEAYELTDKEIQLFLEEKLKNIYENVKVNTEARKTIKTLTEKGFEIILITAREPELQDLTKKWLTKHMVPFSELIHEQNKAPVAINKNINLFIEDNAKNACDLIKKGITVLLLDKFHNFHLPEYKGLIRVKNWKHIRKLISTFFNIEL